MFWVAFILAVAAALCFAATTLADEHPRRAWIMPLGFFLLTVAWMLAAVWAGTSGRVSIK